MATRLRLLFGQPVASSSACSVHENQAEHHRRVSFQEEFRQILSRCEIAFDERYVWD